MTQTATSPAPSARGADAAPAGQSSEAPEPAPAGAPEADDISANPLDLLNGRVGGAVLAVISFWVIALLLPDSTANIAPGVASTVTWILLAVGIVVPIVLPVATRKTQPPERVEVIGAFSLFLFFMILTSVWWLASSKIVSFSPPMKVAFAVGGSALAALAIGLLLFRTLRVAASLPVVVLFIGLVTFPGAREMVGDLGNTLVGWMGAILGASALAEGATQVTQSVQRGGVSKAVAKSGAATDAQAASRLRRALLPDNGRASGDLR